MGTDGGGTANKDLERVQTVLRDREGKGKRVRGKERERERERP